MLSLNISGRSKEFSIRKVLGARIENIGSIIIKQYLVVFFTSLLLAAFISYYLTDVIFSTFYNYYMPMNYSFFIVSGSLLIIVIIAIVGVQIRRVASNNAVEGLRNE